MVPAYIAYCEATTDKNGVEIQIEVKKHNKDLFFEAIESQLMYMPAIKFMHREQGNTTHQEIDIAAKILYQDKNVIISESTIFDKPHILLGTGNALVNYGYVAFNELEIEPKRGSVGLIMDINEMEVTPSRESPLWSAKTRAAVLAKYRMVSEMASTYLNNELSTETDYLLWVTKAAQILGSMRIGGSNTSVLGRLASIIDMDDIGSVVYPCNNKIIFDPKPKEMLGDSLTVRIIHFDSYRRKIERKIIADLGSLVKPVYFTKFGSNPFKDRYLFEENGEFVLINVKDQAVLDTKGTLVTSSSVLKDYDGIVIPQDRMDLYLTEADPTEDDEDGASALSAPKVDYSANRKANKQIVIHTLSGSGGTYDYKFSSRDCYITDLFTLYTDKLVLYTTGSDRETMSNILAMFPQGILDCTSSYKFGNITDRCTHMPFPTKNRITGVLLAQENVKYVQNSSKYLSIPDFLVKSYNRKTGLLTFTDLVKFAATNSVIASLYREKFKDITNRMGYESIKYLDTKFQALAEFCNRHYDSYEEKPLKDIMTHTGFMHDLVLFSLYANKIIEASDETIEELKTSINTQVPDYLCDVVDDIVDVDIIDVDLVRKMISLLDYYAISKEMVKSLSYYSTYNKDEYEIIGKQLQKYFKFVNDNKE